MDKITAEKARKELTMILLYLSRFTDGNSFSDAKVYIPPREHHLHGVLAPRSRCFSATLYGVEHHPL